MNKKIIRDILIRSAKTFLEAFGGTLAASLAVFSGLSDFDTLKKVFFSALAAGIAAVLTVMINTVVKVLTLKIEDINVDGLAEEIEEAMSKIEGGGEHDD